MAGDRIGSYLGLSFFVESIQDLLGSLLPGTCEGLFYIMAIEVRDGRDQECDNLGAADFETVFRGRDCPV